MRLLYSHVVLSIQSFVINLSVVAHVHDLQASSKFMLDVSVAIMLNMCLYVIMTCKNNNKEISFV